MKYKILLAVLFWAGILTISCNRDDIDFDTPSQELRFSTDTVFCDTVYHQVRSETYAVKVYNDEDKDIMIPKIELGRGGASLYRINIDGTSGFSFTNVPLRKKDSLYIFVEIAPTASGPEMIAEDRITFTTPAASQQVTLFSVVQDAEFFVQTNTPGSNILTGNHTWNNNKVKLIYGDLSLAPGATLNVQAGTKVYFFRNSGMKLQNGSALNINGDLNSEVIFRGDRNDPRYDTIPKNWNSIRMEAGSMLNMNYAKVYGGTTGIEMKEAQANIKNSIIHTFDEHGIMAINSVINAENLVMNNCRFSDFGIYKGGSYHLTHVTLANYWNLGTLGNGQALYATNEWTNPNGQTETAPLTLNIRNSILYSRYPNAVDFKPVSGQSFQYLIQNSLLKYDASAGFNFDGNPNIVASHQNLDPEFENYYTEKLNMRVKSTSPARGKGNTSVAATVPLDLQKISRTANPTLGAYQ